MTGSWLWLCCSHGPGTGGIITRPLTRWWWLWHRALPGDRIDERRIYCSDNRNHITRNIHHRGHYSCLCKQEHQLSSRVTNENKCWHLYTWAPFTHYLQVTANVYWQKSLSLWLLDGKKLSSTKGFWAWGKNRGQKMQGYFLNARLQNVQQSSLQLAVQGVAAGGCVLYPVIARTRIYRSHITVSSPANLCELLATDLTPGPGKLGCGWLDSGNWDWEGFHPLATAVTSERKFAMISNDDNTHGSQIQTFIPIERAGWSTLLLPFQRTFLPLVPLGWWLNQRQWSSNGQVRALCSLSSIIWAIHQHQWQSRLSSPPCFHALTFSLSCLLSPIGPSCLLLAILWLLIGGEGQQDMGHRGSTHTFAVNSYRMLMGAEP